MSGNSFGKLFVTTTFGESHGPAIGGIVDGCPPGLALSETDLQLDLDRRRPGKSRHTTQRRESDRVQILSGVFEGVTTGTPIGLLIHNEDQRSKDYSEIAAKFRPGHADYTYTMKYGVRDYRGGGRSSARETAIRVAAGGIAKKYLRDELGIRIRGYLSRLGPIRPRGFDWERGRAEPLLLPGRGGGTRDGVLHGRPAQVRGLDRGGGDGGGRGRPARAGGAGLRPPGCGHRARAHEHQRGQGGRDRCRLRLRRAEGERAPRRDVARAVSSATTPAACWVASPAARTSSPASRSRQPRASGSPAGPSTPRGGRPRS